MKTVSRQAAEYVAQSEGFSATAYVDDDKSTPGRVEYSIGYGHQIQPYEQHLLTAKLTKDQALDILQKDLQTRLDALNSALTVRLHDKQKIALLDYSMSMSPDSLRSGSVVRLINSRAPITDIISRLLSTYVTVGGNFFAPLYVRRLKEAKTYVEGATETNQKIGAALMVLAVLLTFTFIFTL